MATEHFCLRWNNHQSTLVSVFDNLLESGTLVDCTLAADGRYLKAHKVVLSACSPYLGMLLSQHYDKHPIIILKDVKFEELKAMLDYMYRGEVNISQEQLSTFLKAAETLQIKGLTDAGSDEGNGLQSNRPPSSNSTTSANEDPQSPGPPGDGGSSPGPRKRKRNKHGDDGEGDSASKISLSEGSDRLSATSVGSPSAKSGSVKREPGDGDGDGQLSVDESGEVMMMSRPGPSNGGTNNKAPWILSADSSGEEMQLTPQDGQLGLGNQEIITLDQENKSELEGVEILNEKITPSNRRMEAPPVHSWDEENSQSSHIYPRIVYNTDRSGEGELIIPDSLEEQDPIVNRLTKNVCSTTKTNSAITQPDKSQTKVVINVRSDLKETNNYVSKKNQDTSSLINKTANNQFPKRREGMSESLNQKYLIKLVPCSKTSVSDKSNLKVEQIKKKTFDITTKYRSILPATKDVQRKYTESSVPTSSTPTSTSSFENAKTSSGTNQPTVFSVPQQIQVGQIRNQSPSLISIQQPLQGNQMIRPPNVLAYPQNVQSSQMSNVNSSVLSLAPQFTISPMQIGNNQMPFANTTLQAGGFQNNPYRVSQSQQTGKNQNSVLTRQAQPVLQPVYVTPNVINSCQTSSQFLPSTVQYNFNQPFQPNFGVAIPQSQPNVMTPTSAASSSSQTSGQSVLMKTSSNFTHTKVTNVLRKEHQ
ncbi:longitudinals lacking protein, isoforms J/P/Q/S/Z-like isoform X1 [Macrosteles quadrilineatus]|uniref:longitudinals lacking protein, isoforms J/P/Q/S/Z-like isoform X1 n=1 Tax=Macrosteles quadrilineatus TaxID=74068 RepID=UPI0023E1E925|nr:longitudinals lacking protein, isoforms J/P/Q/S/Z-like isoform X1 [Macrosteles quadrilineatus]